MVMPMSAAFIYTDNRYRQSPEGRRYKVEHVVCGAIRWIIFATDNRDSSFGRVDSEAALQIKVQRRIHIGDILRFTCLTKVQILAHTSRNKKAIIRLGYGV